jgi:hypothetical protein
LIQQIQIQTTRTHNIHSRPVISPMTSHRTSLVKRPPGQFRVPPFYWRGGDVLNEQEFLRDEYRTTLADHRSVQGRLRLVNADVSEATSVLHEREGYTNALAAFLEQDVTCAKQEAAMRERLRQIEAEIESLHFRVSQLRATQNPATANILRKEHAYFWIEIQRGQQEIQTAIAKGDEAKRQMAACMANGRYRDAIRIEEEYRRLTKKRHRLRVMTSAAQLEFQALKPITALQDRESREERVALWRNLQAQMELVRMEDRSDRRTAKRRGQLGFWIGQIEELNQRLVDLGVEEGVIDCAALRERMMPDGEEEQGLPPEETFQTRPDTHQTLRV